MLGRNIGETMDDLIGYARHQLNHMLLNRYSYSLWFQTYDETRDELESEVGC